MAFYEESRPLPRSPPHLPRAPPSALRPQGPGTTVAGPTQDQGTWASPLSRIWGGETGAFLHHTCGCSHIPLTIPGKIKPQNCTGASSLPKRPPLWGAWVRWGVGERRRDQELEYSWRGDRRGCLSPFWEGSLGEGILAVTMKIYAFLEGPCLCEKGTEGTHSPLIQSRALCLLDPAFST